jgi:hypothetical protein
MKLRSAPTWKKDIADRTPDGWYGLATPSGWDELVFGLHEQIKVRFPDYEIHQIKEKFGELRYYCSVSSECRDLIAPVSEASTHTCQACGAPGTFSEKPGPVRVLCPKDDADPNCTNGYDLRLYTRRRPLRRLLASLGW